MSHQLTNFSLPGSRLNHPRARMVKGAAIIRVPATTYACARAAKGPRP